jgi:hypothetical protein
MRSVKTEQLVKLADRLTRLQPLATRAELIEEMATMLAHDNIAVAGNRLESAFAIACRNQAFARQQELRTRRLRKNFGRVARRVGA